jgi:hypothetical protein
MTAYISTPSPAVCVVVVNKSHIKKLIRCFETNIGIAVSSDLGATWKYHGIAQGLNFEDDTSTFWCVGLCTREIICE